MRKSTLPDMDCISKKGRVDLGPQMRFKALSRTFKVYFDLKNANRKTKKRPQRCKNLNINKYTTNLIGNIKIVFILKCSTDVVCHN